MVALCKLINTYYGSKVAVNKKLRKVDIFTLTLLSWYRLFYTCIMCKDNNVLPSRGILQHTSDKVTQWWTSTVVPVCWKLHKSNMYVCSSTWMYEFITDRILLPAVCRHNKECNKFIKHITSANKSHHISMMHHRIMIIWS